MRDPVIYRQATVQDLQQLIELRIAYLKDDFGRLTAEEEHAMREQMASYFPAQLGKDLQIFVAEADGLLVSTVFVITIPKPAGPMFPCGKTGLVLNVYTRPEFRRQGHAAALMRAAIADARTQHVAYLELKATEDGLPLYRYLGFQEEKSKYVAMKFPL